MIGFTTASPTKAPATLEAEDVRDEKALKLVGIAVGRHGFGWDWNQIWVINRSFRTASCGSALHVRVEGRIDTTPNQGNMMKHALLFCIRMTCGILVL